MTWKNISLCARVSLAKPSIFEQLMGLALNYIRVKHLVLLGRVDVDQYYTVDIFDLLTLSDLISSNYSSSCGYQISDVNDDGTTNLLDVFEFVALIMQGWYFFSSIIQSK